MKAIVKTDTWKAGLSAGDYISDQDFAPDIIKNADQAGYVRIEDEEYQDLLKENCPHLEILKGEGYTKFSEVREASDDQLLEIEGIGPARLKEIRTYTE